MWLQNMNNKYQVLLSLRIRKWRLLSQRVHNWFYLLFHGLLTPPSSCELSWSAHTQLCWLSPSWGNHRSMLPGHHRECVQAKAEVFIPVPSPRSLKWCSLQHSLLKATSRCASQSLCKHSVGFVWLCESDWRGGKRCKLVSVNNVKKNDSLWAFLHFSFAHSVIWTSNCNPLLLSSCKYRVWKPSETERRSLHVWNKFCHSEHSQGRQSITYKLELDWGKICLGARHWILHIDFQECV